MSLNIKNCQAKELPGIPEVLFCPTEKNQSENLFLS